ncbi:hypothetical protein GCM10023221_12890 [Luteimicrobium xylanilyticum]|uniref:Beta-galactosidase n=1 Tax=Luteimicrobium xylanilyticum TaxID=1133546 RepID=A0A5P9QCP5_9MICO|nr:DUF302 domain-containing protein [Luteimicrobium xylanilyticum]QFU99238.1 Beta-galactosidase [Luteimicrobium xylanilyticum]
MDEDLVALSVPGTVADAVAEVERSATASGMTVSGLVDHAAAARDVGLELDDAVVVTFGNPRVGTRLMQADPRSALDLPLRLLVYSDAGTTTLLYRRPRTLGAAFALEGEEETLATLAGALARLVSAVAGAVDPSAGASGPGKGRP